MKHLRILSIIALVAFGASFQTSEAKAHVDGYAIADGVLGIVGGALARHGHRHYYYDDDYYGYSDYPRYFPRYRFYRKHFYPRYYKHKRYNRKHYRLHRKHYRRH